LSVPDARKSCATFAAMSFIQVIFQYFLYPMALDEDFSAVRAEGILALALNIARINVLQNQPLRPIFRARRRDSIPVDGTSNIYIWDRRRRRARHIGLTPARNSGNIHKRLLRIVITGNDKRCNLYPNAIFSRIFQCCSEQAQALLRRPCGRIDRHLSSLYLCRQEPE